jgi:hypothetical protein
MPPLRAIIDQEKFKPTWIGRAPGRGTSPEKDTIAEFKKKFLFKK